MTHERSITLEANGGQRTLKPYEFDQMQAAQAQADAEAEHQRQQMQQSMQQQGTAVHQMYPNPDHQAAQAAQQQPQVQPQPGMQMPQMNPNSRAFTGGLVAGIVIGGIAMAAIRKANVTIIPEGGN